MPTSSLRLAYFGVFEFNRDTYGERVVEERIETNNQIRLWVHTDYGRDVAAERVEADGMVFLSP